MNSTTFTGAVQYSEPLRLAPEERAVVHVLPAPAAGAELNIRVQCIPSPPGDDPARPNDCDSRWAQLVILDASVGDQVYSSPFGSAWVRVCVLADDYTSGSAVVYLTTTR